MAGMRPPKVPEKIITPFKADHIRRLLAQCELSSRRFEVIRNKAIILTFLDSGLRLAELANIKLNDIDEDNEKLSANI
jgi:site-specific recombinase XerC